MGCRAFGRVDDSGRAFAPLSLVGLRRWLSLHLGEMRQRSLIPSRVTHDQTVPLHSVSLSESGGARPARAGQPQEPSFAGRPIAPSLDPFTTPGDPAPPAPMIGITSVPAAEVAGIMRCAASAVMLHGANVDFGDCARRSAPSNGTNMPAGHGDVDGRSSSGDRCRSSWRTTRTTCSMDPLQPSRLRRAQRRS